MGALIGYAGIHLLHLLIAGGVPPAGADFSRLPVPGAYLRDVALPRLNFTHADLTDSVFTDAFGQKGDVKLELSSIAA